MMRESKMRKSFKDFIREEDGMGTVEVILIIVDILTI
jgi:Flp pilus assembly pilin Flp